MKENHKEKNRERERKRVVVEEHRSKERQKESVEFDLVYKDSSFTQIAGNKRKREKSIWRKDCEQGVGFGSIVNREGQSRQPAGQIACGGHWPNSTRTLNQCLYHLYFWSVYSLEINSHQLLGRFARSW